MDISIETINKVLSAAMSQGRNQSIGYFVEKQTDEDDTGNYYYRHPEWPDGICLCASWKCNSYGGDDRITYIKFVKIAQKTVTIYEPIL